MCYKNGAMCTVVIVKDATRALPLLLAANRDEFLQRPWQPPAVRGGADWILSPTDGEAGGTWIGVNVHGLVVAITNRRMATRFNHRSRGLLVHELLTATSVDGATASLNANLTHHAYNDFNLMIADVERARLFRLVNNTPTRTELADGVHCITNMHELNQAPIDRADLMGASTWPDWQRQASALLSDHHTHDDGYAVCKHHGAYGTSSATLMGLGRAGLRHFEFAAGAPCENAFTPFNAP